MQSVETIKVKHQTIISMLFQATITLNKTTHIPREIERSHCLPQTALRWQISIDLNLSYRVSTHRRSQSKNRQK